jgi:glutamate synthase domain-containing protein 3
MQGVMALASATVRDDTPEDAVTIDARGLHYRALNEQIAACAEGGARHICVRGVLGQRYLGTSLQREVRLTIEGIPGQDLGAFMDGPEIEVYGHAQDGCGNTMNAGSIVIHGSAGDVVGLSMRGGRILVRDNVGYRVGIHMKEYEAVKPVIVIGGTAQHFLGEYMAGGTLIVLGRRLGEGEAHPSRYIGTGMHGGAIYIRGRVDPDYLGKEVGVVEPSGEEMWLVRRHVLEFARRLRLDAADLLDRPFVKLLPLTRRPYGRLYAT